MRAAYLSFLSALILSACSFNLSNFDPESAESAQVIFDRAQELRMRNQYRNSEEMFANVELIFPLDPLTPQAQYYRGVVLYEAQLYEEAVAAFDRFLAFNPSDPLVLSARHTRALCFYDEIPDVYRDQGVTRQAREALRGLIKDYPGTEVAEDAAAKLVLVRDQLAGHNMVIGVSYQRQNRLLAAQNRFKIVVEDFPTTAQVPEAFYRLVETSLALGLVGQARSYGATLGHNYPASRWYGLAYDLLTDSRQSP